MCNKHIYALVYADNNVTYIYRRESRTLLTELLKNKDISSATTEPRLATSFLSSIKRSTVRDLSAYNRGVCVLYILPYA